MPRIKDAEVFVPNNAECDLRRAANLRGAISIFCLRFASLGDTLLRHRRWVLASGDEGRGRGSGAQVDFGGGYRSLRPR